MEREMLNINGNLVGDIKFDVINGKEREVAVANFTLVYKDKNKKKKYIYCNLYGDKTEVVKDFESGEYVHVFGYFKEVKKDEKTFKNFIVKHVNRIEKQMEEIKERESEMEE